MDIIEKTIQILLNSTTKPPNPRTAGKAMRLHRKHVNLPTSIVCDNTGLTEEELGDMECGEFIPSIEQIEILSTLYGLNVRKVKRGFGYEET